MALEAALSESPFPFKVDVLYRNELSEPFRHRIAEAWEPVQPAPFQPLAGR